MGPEALWKWKCRERLPGSPLTHVSEMISLPPPLDPIAMQLWAPQLIHKVSCTASSFLAPLRALPFSTGSPLSRGPVRKSYISALEGAQLSKPLSCW